MLTLDKSSLVSFKIKEKQRGRVSLHEPCRSRKRPVEESLVRTEKCREETRKKNLISMGKENLF